ncbi:MAG TPA: DUF6599 family protein [Terriglobales bacterium]|nr:DUF6599 family protein [Terriglobales bacterium]
MRKGFSPLRLALMIAVCGALLGSAGCNRGTRTNTTPFPASDEVEGWARTGAIRSFEAADLWKYIDGEAERYLKSGTLRVVTADYKFQNQVEAVVDIYTMGNSESAAKIFDSEPIGDAKEVQLGDGGRLYGQSLVFRAGPYLVRIVTYQESAQTAQALLQLGRSIERRLTR